VVIVTTKRGKAGQSNIQFESYYGVQSVRKKLPLLNAREYAEYLNEARVNGGSQPYFNGSAPDRPLPSSFSEGTDWQDEVFRNAPIQNYQLTFSGGEQKTRYAISGSYFDQSGIVVNSRFKRFTLRANLDRDISSRIKVGLSMQAARVNSNAIRSDVDGGTAAGVTTAAMNYLPIFPVYNNSGQYFKDQTTLNPFPVDNPVAIANEVRNRIFTNRVLANTYLDVKLLEGLVFRTTLGGDLLDNKNNYYASRNTFLSGGIGSASIIADQSFNWLSENTLTYSKTFLENHSITALLGYTYQEANYEGVTANATNFTSDFASYNNLGAGATLVAPASGATQWALLSYLSRINYSYSNRYLLTLTARRDGSSRFGPTNKFGFFPSGAFAWRIANESFMSGQNIFSDLKLRVSYGLTGNQEIGDYRFLPALNSPTYIFGTTGSRFIGAVPGGISNLDLQWEKNAQFDVGLDMALLRGRLNITVDYYNKRTSDLLFNVNVPLTTGFGSALKNIGSVENKGWELEISSINLDNRNLSWRTSLNLAQNKNKVLKLDGRPEFLSGLGSGHLQISNPILMRVGIPLGSFYGRIMDGIFQNQQEVDKSAQPSAKPGDIRYRDLNNDGVINDNDRTVIGNGYPKLIGGLDNTINYKGFELNVFLNGSYGNKILNLTRFDLYSLNGQQQAKEVVNRWTPTNPSNTIPRANIGGGQKILSTFQIEDGSYLRLRNLSLGYNLPSGALKRLALSSMKIYVSAQNLLTFTNYSGYDPEINFQGTNSISQSLDYGGYPAAKTFLVGLNMRF
jgi:TonB-linked SusC/RagA family outer membrane protein